MRDAEWFRDVSRVTKSVEHLSSELWRRPLNLEVKVTALVDGAGPVHSLEASIRIRYVLEGSLDALEIGFVPHHGDDRKLEALSQLFKIEYVESAEGNPIDQGDVKLGEKLAALEKLDHGRVGVPAIGVYRSPYHAIEPSCFAYDPGESDRLVGSSLEGSIVESDRTNRLVAVEDVG